ncbi:MAG: RagB/SusD family nutrient uptake outer membrane protein, partial [Chitinophagaceae bacterium]
MKFRIIALVVAFTTIFTTGCNKFLDQVPDDRLTLEETFRTRGSAEAFLANVYTMIPREWTQRFVGDRNAGPWTGAADEGEYLWGFVASNSMNTGSWDAGSGFTKDFWRNFYRGIRSATIFIANIDKVSVDIDASLQAKYKAEARALRAMYYYYLIRIYGPVVILGDEEIPVDAPSDQINFPRNSMDQCVDFIIKELDIAAADLPVRQTDERNFGRLTKGIAKSFKARTLLLAASPLYNGNTDFASLKNDDGLQLINQSYDENKWKLASDEYKAFINEFVPSVYSIYRKNDGS